MFLAARLYRPAPDLSVLSFLRTLGALKHGSVCTLRHNGPPLLSEAPVTVSPLTGWTPSPWFKRWRIKDGEASPLNQQPGRSRPRRWQLNPRRDYAWIHFLLPAGRHKPLLQIVRAWVFDLWLRVHRLHRNQQFMSHFNTKNVVLPASFPWFCLS